MEYPFEESEDFKTVFLSTRITQVENQMLNEIGGWLQTANVTATIRKQEIVRRTIRMAYDYLQLQIADMDKQNADISPEPENHTHTIPTKRTQVLDLKIYHEIANKTTNQNLTLKPTHTINHAKARTIQKGLGL